MRPAVFFDRDGTLIEQVHYLSDPNQVALLPGAAESLRRLAEAGFVRVVITNQSAIGRGYMTVEDYEAVHAEFERQLADHDVRLDGTYYCPLAPQGKDRTAIEHPDRKPGPGMLLRAASELGLELGDSWMIGDMISDIHAGRNAGCRGTILVQTGHGSTVETHGHPIDHIAPDIRDATDFILASVEGSGGA